ncbi:MAG: SpoIIE family protein phosphatase [Salinivirgaceae bacterium]|nr:SpoIIE family protein phosphatase [Salinivirgaceae bacterium]
MIKKLILKLIYRYILLISAIVANTPLSMAQDDVDTDYDRQMDSLVRVANILPNGAERLKVLERVCMGHNNVDTVEKYADIELDLAQRLDSQRLVISANMVKGWCHYNRYDYNTANTFYFKAMRIADSIGDKRGLALCFHSIANSMAMMSKYIEADNYDQKALKLFIEMNDSANISYIYRSLGLTCIDFNMYKTAMRHFNNALEIDLKQNRPVCIANDYLYIGTAERSEFNDTRIDSLIVGAKKHTMMALELMKKIDEDSDLIIAYENMMSILLEYAKTKTGDRRKELVDSSKLYYSKGIALAERIGLLDNSHDFRIIEARYAIEDGDFGSAYKKLKNIEKRLDADSAFVLFYIELYDVFAEYYKATGNYKQAFDYMNKAAKLRKDNFSLDYALKSNKSEVQNEFDKLRRDRELKDEEAKMLQDAQETRQRTVTWAAVGFIAIMLVFIWLTRRNLKRKHRLGRILELHNHEIEKQRDQLALVNQQIISSVNYAQKIQNSMMPTHQQMTDILGETLIIWKPLNIVSGDFYWATRCGKRKIVTIVDCTGHGVPGAFMSMLGMSTLCDIANTHEFQSGQLTAACILELMRTKVIEALHQNELSGMSLDGMDMALCIIDDETLTLQYAGAFRPLVVIRNGETIVTKADKMPIGYLSENAKAFRNNNLQMQKGDVVYLFSDGLTDQFGCNNRGKEAKFSTRRLVDILVDVHSKPFASQKAAIEKAISKWRTPSTQKHYPQTDDMILVGFRI